MVPEFTITNFFRPPRIGKDITDKPVIRANTASPEISTSFEIPLFSTSFATPEVAATTAEPFTQSEQPELKLEASATTFSPPTTLPENRNDLIQSSEDTTSTLDEPFDDNYEADQDNLNILGPVTESSSTNDEISPVNTENSNSGGSANFNPYFIDDNESFDDSTNDDTAFTINDNAATANPADETNDDLSEAGIAKDDSANLPANNNDPADISTNNNAETSDSTNDNPQSNVNKDEVENDDITDATNTIDENIIDEGANLGENNRAGGSSGGKFGRRIVCDPEDLTR